MTMGIAVVPRVLDCKKNKSARLQKNNNVQNTPISSASQNANSNSSHPVELAKAFSTCLRACP